MEETDSFNLSPLWDALLEIYNEISRVCDKYGFRYYVTDGRAIGAVRALALELAPKHTRVNAICPSNIKTPMVDNLAGDMNDELAMAELKAKQLLGIGTPEQVAASVCFLLSDAASFITGVNLPVDGGYLAQ